MPATGGLPAWSYKRRLTASPAGGANYIGSSERAPYTCRRLVARPFPLAQSSILMVQVTIQISTTKGPSSKGSPACSLFVTSNPLTITIALVSTPIPNVVR